MGHADGLPDAEHERWHRLIDGFNRVVTEEFGEEADGNGRFPVFVIGAQWGEMGAPGGEWPVCVISSNLPVCIVGQAIEDMAEAAEQEHAEFHDLQDKNTVEEPVAHEDVPEALREFAEKIAGDLGVGMDQVQFMQLADMSDLVAEPETEEPVREPQTFGLTGTIETNSDTDTEG